MIFNLPNPEESEDTMIVPTLPEEHRAFINYNKAILKDIDTSSEASQLLFYACVITGRGY